MSAIIASKFNRMAIANLRKKAIAYCCTKNFKGRGYE
jgi:hypothetical protein